MKLTAFILVAYFALIQGRCVFPELDLTCEKGSEEGMCCVKSGSCDKNMTCESADEKKDEKDDKKKTCELSMCCICCSFLIVEPARLELQSFQLPKDVLPVYSNNFYSTYISTCWNPPELV